MKRSLNPAALVAVIAVAVALLPMPGVAQAGIKTVMKILGHVNQGMDHAAKTVNNVVQSRKGSSQGSGYGNNNWQTYPNYGTPIQTNGYGQTYAGPRTNALPSVAATPAVSAGPQANVLPNADVQVAPVEPIANLGIRRNVVSLAAADIDRMRSELIERNRMLLDSVQRDLDDSIGTTLVRLAGPTGMSEADKTVLLPAITRGDVDAVRRLLSPRQINSVTGRTVISLAEARQLTSKLLVDVNRKGLSVVDLSNLLAAVRDVVPQRAIEAINSLATNEQLLSWLDQTVIGTNEIPTGDDVPVALVSGLAAGTMIPLGFGPVLVGLGQPGDQILIGSGNPMQLAGLASPLGTPVADATDASTARVILGNTSASVVHYNLDQTPYSMESTYEQELTNGTSWVVEFDRGNGNGTARYTLTDGYYEFTATATGWELYNQTYRTTLNNQNNFEFNYVVDGKQQVIAAGQSVELTGSLPPVIRFEDGAGQIKQKRLSGEKFDVAMAGKNGVDIYPTSSMATTKTATTNAATTKGDMKVPAGFRKTELLASVKPSNTVAAAESPRSSLTISLFSSGSPAPQTTASAR